MAAKEGLLPSVFCTSFRMSLNFAPVFRMAQQIALLAKSILAEVPVAFSFCFFFFLFFWVLLHTLFKKGGICWCREGFKTQGCSPKGTCIEPKRLWIFWLCDVDRSEYVFEHVWSSMTLYMSRDMGWCVRKHFHIYIYIYIFRYSCIYRFT